MIDTHCHLNFPSFEPDFSQVWEKTSQLLDRVIVIGTGLNSSQKAVSLAKEYPQVKVAVGLHPHDTEPDTPGSWEEQLVKIREIIQSNRKLIVAVGEVGLDDTKTSSEERNRSAEEQRALFESQIKLAQEFNLPLVIHSRDTYGEVLDILSLNGVSRAVFHCFTGDLSWAERVLQLGFFLSFTGIISFRNASELQQTVSQVPLEKMMLETDAPFLAPEPYRGKRCEPWMVKEVYKKVSEIKKIPLNEVERVIDNNVSRFFDWE